MASLTDFQDMVNSIKDEESLHMIDVLLKDIIEIKKLKNRIKKLEDNIVKGKKSFYWFFAMGLDEEQVELISGTIAGRLRVLQDKKERAKILEKES